MMQKGTEKAVLEDAQKRVYFLEVYIFNVDRKNFFWEVLWLVYQVLRSVLGF